MLLFLYLTHYIYIVTHCIYIHTIFISNTLSYYLFYLIIYHIIYYLWILVGTDIFKERVIFFFKLTASL